MDAWQAEWKSADKAKDNKIQQFMPHQENFCTDYHFSTN
jgi:hypothetical protein